MNAIGCFIVILGFLIIGGGVYFIGKNTTKIPDSQQ